MGEDFSYMSAAVNYIPDDDLRRTIERKIELKRQLIRLTEIEIEVLERELQGKTGDRLITENRQPEPASLV